MQYGVNVSTYKRNKKDKIKQKKNLTENVVKLVVLLLISLFISRVKFINDTAPFGIAFYMVVLMRLDIRENFYCALGTILGYFTIMKDIEYMPVYILIIGALYTLEYFSLKITKEKKLLYCSLIVSVSLFLNYVIFYGIGLYAIMNVFLNLLCIVPIFYLLNKSVISYRNIFRKLFFSTEEIISSGILIALAVSGMNGLSIINISLMNISALIIVMVLSYMCGAPFGASVGVCIGIICGMSDVNMMMYVTIYSVVGLSVGIIRDSGKWISVLFGVFVYFILILYHKEQSVFIGIEACIAASAYLLIPDKVYVSLGKRINIYNKEYSTEMDYMERAKGAYLGKVKNFSHLLYNISNSLNEYIDNDKLEMKYKSSALVQNLADRVCYDCNLNNMCWKREMHYTYAAFGEMIQNIRSDSKILPDRLEKKCVKQEKLLNNAEDIVNKFVVNEMKKNSFYEGRKMISEQINSIADSMERVIEEIDTDIYIDVKKEDQIKDIFNSKEISLKSVECIVDKNERSRVALKVEACGACNECVKTIQPIIDKVYNKKMRKTVDGCCINQLEKTCKIVFEEMPKFHVESYKIQKCKDSETENGDSVVDFKLDSGEYVCIISDGMGSGPSAARESKSITDLLGRFIESGFDKLSSLNTINSVMTMKYREDEKFSTVDLSSIDLYSGDLEFIKVGAVESFIKRRNNIVETVESASLPIGVLDKMDLDRYNNNVEDGDIIVMISDGILDYTSEVVGSAKWIKEYLRKNQSIMPKEIATGIMNEAVRLGGNKIKDDMTILVTRVYSIE